MLFVFFYAVNLMIEFLCCYKRVRLKKAVVFKEKELNLSKRSDNLYSDCFGKIPDFRRLQKVYKKQKHCALPVLIDTSVL